MVKKEKDITEVLKIYAEKLEAFKKEMKALGVKVEVRASIGPFRSVVEDGDEDG